MPETFESHMIQRVLIRAPNWIGDAVMCTPALQGIRESFPAAEITLLARPAIVHLLRHHPSLDHAIEYDHQGPHAGLRGKLRLACELKSRGFDLAILFPNAFEAALLSFLARIPRRYGFATDGRSLLLTKAIPLSPEAKKLHQVQYYEELIAPLCPAYSSRPPVLSVSKKDEEQAAQLLMANGVAADCVLLGVNPGSMYGGAKRWIPERFAQAADQVIEKLGTEPKMAEEVKGVIVGAPGEERLGHEIGGFMRTDPVILSGKTSIGVLKAVIKRCRLFLTNDTGPMHIASAFAVPVVAIFGSTDHTTTAPFSSGHVVVRTPVDCSPCLLRECPIDHRCMTEVTVAQVVEASKQALELSHRPSQNFLRVES